MITNHLGGRGSTTSSAVSSSPTAIVDELMEALSLGTTTAATTIAALPTAVVAAAATIPATAANIRPCLHGSTSHFFFSDGRAYRDVLQGYFLKEEGERGKFGKGSLGVFYYRFKFQSLYICGMYIVVFKNEYSDSRHERSPCYIVAHQISICASKSRLG